MANPTAALLFHHLFPKHSWKRVTSSILRSVPHDATIVHIAVPPLALFRLSWIIRWLKGTFPKIARILWSVNSSTAAESRGFEASRNTVDLKEYGVLTYAHSNGTSRRRKDTQPIRDWTEMVPYFTIERLASARLSFEEGYLFAGVILNRTFHIQKGEERIYQKCAFIYEGNFVTMNLNGLRDRLRTTPCPQRHYELERYLGMLCGIEQAFVLYDSNPFDHYNQPYPPSR